MIAVTVELSASPAAQGFYAAAGSILKLPVLFEAPVRIRERATVNNCQVGAYTYLSSAALLHAALVGRYCSIGDNVQVLSRHPTEWMSASPAFYGNVFPAPYQHAECGHYPPLRQIRIGSDVWIGSGTRIVTGVRIGDGAIIGAGAVVTKDVAAFSVVGGVPARHIRWRFDEACRARIHAVAWWDYDLRKVPANWSQPNEALDCIERAVASGNAPLLQSSWNRLDYRGDEIVLETNAMPAT
ncbi:MAG TPA: CatB-related O-acetyltransferase [Burkholderiaceae bacterium]